MNLHQNPASNSGAHGLEGDNGVMNVPPRCFHSLALVDVLTNDGVSKRTVQDLTSGDRVLSATENGALFYDEVYYVRKEGEGTILKLTTEDSSISLTGEHLIHVTREDADIGRDYCMNVGSHKACAILAQHVQLGDILWVNNGDKFVPQSITDITNFVGPAFFFATLSGNVVVNNAVASCHSKHHDFAQAAMIPVRLTYYVSKDLPNHPVMDSIWHALDGIRHILRDICMASDFLSKHGTVLPCLFLHRYFLRFVVLERRYLKYEILGCWEVMFLETLVS
eukprot:TRINITY_DN6741_c0_g1_i1.p1 TRINITY_DN6741_c0_g1~~TRINITY_DN6741_c0_g1_i1.p1  ORF type:complete len:280 (+),score=34.33 TRINITY_DN6741_c0_g1_i1:647-1486(+)